MTMDARESATAVRLTRGAMQNWSDFDAASPADTPVARRLVAGLVTEGVRTCLVVGAHSRDFVLAVSQTVAEVTVLVRSTVDAASLAEVLSDEDGVEVVAGSVNALDAGTFDLVVCVDDLATVESLEEDATWAELLQGCANAVREGGTLLLGCRSELGVDAVVGGWDRLTRNTDADWALEATHDASRPATEEQLRDAVARAGLPVRRSMSLHPSWTRPSVVVHGPEELGPALTSLVGHLCAVDEEDPTAPEHLRLVDAAARAGLLRRLASGWLVVAGGERSSVDVSRETGGLVEVVRADSTVSFGVASDGDGLSRRHDGTASDPIRPDDVAPLLLTAVLRACARRDLPGTRVLVSGYAAWVRDQVDASGVLSAEASSASPGNLMWSARPVVVVPRDVRMTADERVWRSLDTVVESLVCKGMLHPWPAATPPETMLEIMAAMAGLAPESRPDGLGRGWPDALPEGLVDPVLERLVEANAALESRAAWFEERLNVRERQLRTLQSQAGRAAQSQQPAAAGLVPGASTPRSTMTQRVARALRSPRRALRHVWRRATAGRRPAG
ncbi:hypothetical protein Q9R29_06440 [Rothia sp. ARF10]|nr:hypothetical protein [Rothia sp. ARF10]